MPSPSDPAILITPRGFASRIRARIAVTGTRRERRNQILKKISMPRILLRAAVVAAACVPAITAHASCGSAFCMVNTNWSVQGVWVEPGPRFDLRYEFLDQDQPMSGSRRVGVGEVPAHHDEVKTINRNIFATIDYGFTPDWGVSVVIPYVDRYHEHIHNHEGEQELEQWDFRDLGDVRVQGRWQTAITSSDPMRAGFAGLTLGLKLPTGKHDVANDGGEVAERTLQPGSGTTDLLLGGYYRQALPFVGSSWFVQAAAQLPLNSRDDFKPGNQFGLDTGYRYDANDRLAWMLQINYRCKARDKGAQAEPEDSGGQAVTASPGVSFAFTPRVQAYAFVQLPIWQYVNGVQLTADWSVAAGISAQF